MFQNQILSLYGLTTLIKYSLKDSFPDPYWVTAEIARIQCNQKGHCYLELVDKRDDTIIAQMSASIWANKYKEITTKFEMIAKETLKSGMKILFLASIQYHEVFGLSLNIKDIDPTYSLGEMARRKREIIERLTKEGLIDLNKKLVIPVVPQRIAIISSPSAAGFEDFVNHITNNIYGYKFNLTLIPSIMQGEEAQRSIIAALDIIQSKKDDFDIVVIVRGGGSQVDLSCFDSYEVAFKLAKLSLPVITGIGHERDDTVVDMVAHTKLKTPTAVAEYLIARVKDFEDKVRDIHKRLIIQIDKLIESRKHNLYVLLQKFKLITVQVITKSYDRLCKDVLHFENYCKRYLMGKMYSLTSLKMVFRNCIKEAIRRENTKLRNIDQAIRLVHPENILKKGFSITYSGGKVLKGIEGINKGDTIETKLYRGYINSKIESIRKGDDGRN